MEAFTPFLGLLTYSLSHFRICPHNALVSYLKLVYGFRACFFYIFGFIVFAMQKCLRVAIKKKKEQEDCYPPFLFNVEHKLKGLCKGEGGGEEAGGGG